MTFAQILVIDDDENYNFLTKELFKMTSGNIDQGKSEPVNTCEDSNESPYFALNEFLARTLARIWIQQDGPSTDTNFNLDDPHHSSSSGGTG